MNKACLQCSAHFEITEDDLKFYDKVSPVFGGKKYLIPPPTICPDCRQQRRLSFRNERKLYKRKCDLCRKDIISVYHSDQKFPIYCPDCWWSDKWRTEEYGQDFDFSKPFFKQFYELSKKVPKWSKIILNGENSEYCVNCADVKNCYLTTSTADSENCLFSTRLFYAQDCLDCLNLHRSELCFECLDSENLYSAKYSQNCKNSHTLEFCFDCIRCENCFLCAGIRGKKFCIFNKEFSEDEFFQKKAEFDRKKLSEKMAIFRDFLQKIPRRNNQNLNSDYCSGNYLFNCKNVCNSFFIFDAEDSIRLTDGKKTKNSHDCSSPDDLIECYEINSAIWGNRTFFSENFVTGNEIFYCSTSQNIQNCFGSIGLRHQQYCILNKQYSKEEYEELVPRIIEHMQRTGEWGEFFPVELSPFAYNETVAQEYFPLKNEDVGANCNSPFRRNWKWREEKDEIPNVTKIIPAEKLPESIDKILDDVLNWAIRCERSGRLFKIQKPELEFYRKMNLPIPHLHPDERHKDRMALRNPRKLWKRKCDNCGIEIETSYSPERPEKVFCEKCYLEAVV